MSDQARDRSSDTCPAGDPGSGSLSVREAAAALGMRERTIRRAIARGDLCAEKHAGSYRIAEADLEQYKLHRPPRVPELLAKAVHPLAPHLVTFPGGNRPAAFTLAPPLTSLVGREREIATVEGLIARDDVPLLTLVGPGGVGKTRLALAVSARIESFPDGVCFVSLAAIPDPRLVPGAIARALGVQGRSDRPPLERLHPVLRGKRLLLVLDNLEHVIGAAPFIAELLGAFADLSVLATSRVPLRISGEHEHEVPPLSLEGPAGETAAPEAVRLFVDRAQAVREDFALTPDNAEDIASICRRLDGLPLAIELAAVRIKIVTPSALLARLGQHLPILADGMRNRPARQQTMRDAIAWSYDLLSPQNQALLRRLSVFLGGMSLEAVEQATIMTGGADVAPFSGLAALVDASLLRHDPGSDGTSRYLMLETVREFGKERLEELGESGIARDAHAAFVVAFGQWLDPNRDDRGRSIDDRLRDIDLEHPNVRSALDYMASTGDARGVLQLASSTAIFWHHRGFLREGRRWLEWALDRTADEPTADRGMALAGLSLILWTQMDTDAAEPPARRALEIAREIGDTELAALSLHVFGLIENVRRNWVKARAYMEEALGLWREIGTASDEAMALIVLSEAEMGIGNHALSGVHAEESLAIFRSLGHASGIAFAHIRLAHLADSRGDGRGAAQAYQAALLQWAGIGERWAIVKSFAGLAEIAAGNGQHDTAATLVGVSDARLEEAGSAMFPVDHGHYDAGCQDGPCHARRRSVYPTPGGGQGTGGG